MNISPFYFSFTVFPVAADIFAAAKILFTINNLRDFLEFLSERDPAWGGPLPDTDYAVRPRIVVWIKGLPEGVP